MPTFVPTQDLLMVEADRTVGPLIAGERYSITASNLMKQTTTLPAPAAYADGHMLVERGNKLFRVTVSDVIAKAANIQDTDLFMCMSQSDGKHYSLEWSQLKTVFKEIGTLFPNNDNTPNEKAMSVAEGIAHPFKVVLSE